MISRRRIVQTIAAAAGLRALAPLSPSLAVFPEEARLALPSQLTGSAMEPTIDSSIHLWRYPASAFDPTPAPDGQQTSLHSPVRQPPAPFDQLVMSWTGQLAPGTQVRFLTRVQIDGIWSDWYAMGDWTSSGVASVRGQRDAIGQVDVDILSLRSAAQAFQLRADVQPGDAAGQLRTIGAVVSSSREQYGPELPEGSAWGIDLDVPRRSQAIQPQPYTWSICSPTSLCMVLGYWGTDLPVMDVAFAVQDHTTGIFGNWPANTAFASTLGYDAWVDRFYTLAQIEQDIADSRPVIVSLRWRSGELPGAPLDSTSGHLIVVRGFTESGDVIVNDPAAPGEASVRRVLPRAAFAKVWLGSGGVVYRLAPLAA